MAVCGRSDDARSGRAALASALRTESRGVGSVRHPVARASACSIQRRTSPNRESERLVVKGLKWEERAASSPRLSAVSIAHTAAGPCGRASSFSGNVDGSGGLLESRLKGCCRGESHTLRGCRRERRDFGCRGGMCTLRGWAAHLML